MFLALGLAALVPFLVRDYLRTRTSLELSTVGLREVGRRQKSVDWSAIQQIIVRERELIHLLKRYSGIELTSGYDY